RGILDHGAYYAQKTQLDAHGNRILWGWITEKRPDSELRAAGWAGCMALPRVLSLSPAGDLEMKISPELKSLRTESFAAPQGSAGSRLKTIAEAVEISNISGEISWKSKAQNASWILSDSEGSWISVTLDSNASSAKLTINGKAIDLPASETSE